MALKFEWDKDKAAINVKKHHVSFGEALTVFEDDNARIFSGETHSVDEDREIIIGMSSRRRILLVCFVERWQHVVRIIRARRATKNERKDYEAHLSRQG